MTRPTAIESRTKIVATVGPACESPEKLAALIEAGVSVFRINTAHGDRDAHAAKLNAVREAGRRVGFEPAVLVDLAGPKIRLGELAEEPHQCEVGAHYRFVRGSAAQPPEDARTLTSSYRKLIDELSVGDRVMLADGTVAMRVESVGDEAAVCVVEAGGVIRSRQGINLPGANLSVSSMLPRDIENAIWAAENDVDLISLSFVRTAEDVNSLKKLLASYECRAMVIAKIEKPEALDNLSSIVAAADGVMVARGDLGVEIDVAETPMEQKRIIAECRRQVKPVIVATQMLESMHTSARPTRAEVSDVANAILDGADACMLSGETAIGDHPETAVRMMARIMRATETKMPPGGDDVQSETSRVRRVTAAVTDAATTIAETIDARMIVIATRSGNTAWVASRRRGMTPMLGVSDDPVVRRRLNLLWGVRPLAADHLDDNEELLSVVRRWADTGTPLKKDDQVVLVKGTGVIARAHNTVLVHRIE